MNIERLIRQAGAEEGDMIEISSKFGKIQGILMPKTASTSDDVVTIKMKNGYNIGIAVKEGTEIRLIEKKHAVHAPAPGAKHIEDRPFVSIIGTGGTIVSYVDYRTGAVHPAVSPEELASSIPELSGYNLRTKMLFSLLSEDMQPEHWKKIAHEAASELNSGARGVVITHGTDTMAYTAAALSFILKNLTGPVVLVGSQRSSDRPSSDANMNLVSAVRVAAESDIGEVVVVMHDSISDDRCAVHRGTRVRKMHTSRRDAFKSINVEPLGYVDKDGVHMVNEYRKAAPASQKVTVDDAMNSENVSMILSYPGLSAEHIKDVVIDGTVLVGTGLGHISNRIIPAIRQVVQRATVVMASQCINGRINMNVYSTGRDLLDAGVIPAQDMTPETAYVKLMWVLGHAKDKNEIRRLMMKNLVGELTEE